MEGNLTAFLVFFSARDAVKGDVDFFFGTNVDFEPDPAFPAKKPDIPIA